MDIKEAQRCLGDFDIEALRGAILAQEEEAGTEQLLRQQEYEVHRDAESIVLLFCDETWPEGEVYSEPGWSRLSEAAMPLINHIINTYYEPGGIVIRAMAAKLKIGGLIPSHTDATKSFQMGHRIYIPITTSSSVRFVIEGRPYSFEVGKAYELNDQKSQTLSGNNCVNLWMDDGKLELQNLRGMTL